MNAIVDTLIFNVIVYFDNCFVQCFVAMSNLSKLIFIYSNSEQIWYFAYITKYQIKADMDKDNIRLLCFTLYMYGLCI